MSNRKVCDECGKTISLEMPSPNWLHVESEIPLTLEMDFCSWRCVAIYSAKRPEDS